MNKLKKAFELLLFSNMLVMFFLVSAIQVSANDGTLCNTLSLNELSEHAVNSNDNSSPIPLKWESECIGVATGYGEPKWVQYCYISTLQIDAFSKDDTNIKGTVEFKFYGLASNYFANCSLSRTVLGSDAIGSYWHSAKAAFTGTYYYAYQSISMNITHGISGSIPQNFSPIKFDGRVNDDLTKIIWQGSVFFNAKYDVPIDEDEEWDSGFIHIWDDNACHAENDFRNNNSFNHSPGNFYPVNNICPCYSISNNDFFEKLKNICYKFGGSANIDKLEKKMFTAWGGACYGISTTMALVFKRKLSNYDLIKEEGDKDCYHYYLLPKPIDNEYFRDVLNYYYLIQYCIPEVAYKLGKHVSINTKNFQENMDVKGSLEIDKFLSELVKDSKEAAKNHKVLQLNYSYLGADGVGGHSILITGYKHYKNLKYYALRLYDMNNFKRVPMIISDNFETFSFIDGLDDVINTNTYRSMWYTDPINYLDFSHLNSQKNAENYTHLCFSSDSSFKITSDTGLSLTYENNEFSGDLPLFSLDYIDKEIKIKTAYCSSYKIEPISRDIDINIYDNDHFKAVVGNNIESIDVSIPGDMKLNGNIYIFKAYASVEEMLDEKESGMGSIFAKGKGEVVIHPAQNTVEATSKKPMSGIETAVYQGVDVIEGTIKGNQKKIVLKVTEDKDNHNLEEGGKVMLTKEDLLSHLCLFMLAGRA